ncbi:phosphoenolpyruvate synthase [Pseudolabrys taiwanensis]|uniref:Phosphoenolpyruvate synthase n=1 Tax=Pseudolabrys taiwanensis TaxID=331696 RepID=A0A345ZV29_9HYPH|nr:phosphoenolpyruvate synthase [Pseudolabrys taiwanensis]AXK80776.1 phosphoenolpyruvate synthase [Pseudolabrys taiwanensis]
MPQDCIRWFADIRVADVGQVGGKNASLGELYATLASADVRVPNGFAVTADAFRDVLTEAKAWEPLHRLLDGLDKRDIARLAAAGAEARRIVYAAADSGWLNEQVVRAYRQLEAEYGANVAVAVRSSATAEDLPNASFAGQHESYLNVSGPDALFEATRRCLASLFTDRAISYRIDNGFDHFKVALSVGVMKMVRAGNAASGVMFTLDTESGFRDVVFVSGIYGLGENIVQGVVDPDEFYVHKPTYRAGKRAVLSRALGRKHLRMIYAEDGGTRNVPVPEDMQARFCLDDDEVLKLAGDAIAIEQHYSANAGHSMPMDIEWAKDSEDGQLYVIQARPETVVSQRAQTGFETYALGAQGTALATGRAVGEKIASGAVRIVTDARQLTDFKPGEVLVAEQTTPDWEPVMKIAAAIVTERGGRTCHAAIVARELGVPAVVGAEDARRKLTGGAQVTVSCAEGEVGRVYDGALPIKTTKVEFAALKKPRTAIMLNLGNPDLAFRSAMLPSDGVGLARMEFIISEHIRVHPMALVHPERVTSPAAREEIAKLVRGYASPSDYFVRKLSEGIGTIGAAFYPKPVIVRLSDFKTNEYARLVGGEGFEPREENPMLGFRGAARYAHPAYREGFALECAALRRVREDMGLTNVLVMVPFCRRVEEARRVIETMAANSLKRGENGLEIYVMCEIPNNVIQIDAFAELFDGFSIGSNDLTQLTLGVDRDSDIVAFDFDERDPGMLEMLRLAVTGAKRNGRHVGICGEAPANYPEIASFLAKLGIDSISVNPSSLLHTIDVVAEAEGKT